MKLLSSKNLGDLLELVEVIAAFEEGVFLENLNKNKFTMPAIMTPRDHISNE